MKIEIKLTKDTNPRLTEPFLAKEDKEIALSFKTDYDLSKAKINLKNGETVDTFDFKKEFIVPDKFMFTGRLFVSVEMFMCGNVVKKWDILPISIEKTVSGLKIVDYLSSIEERVKILERYLEII